MSQVPALMAGRCKGQSSGGFCLSSLCHLVYHEQPIRDLRSQTAMQVAGALREARGACPNAYEIKGLPGRGPVKPVDVSNQEQRRCEPAASRGLESHQEVGGRYELPENGPCTT